MYKGCVQFFFTFHTLHILMFCAVAIYCVLKVCMHIYICKIVDYICWPVIKPLSRRAVVYFQVSQFLKYANCFSNTRADWKG